MKGHKGEGGKPSQGKGGLASGDREPLFPRLHVNETEKAGPKAPPRNKMALYEQFTVPSHRFVQPSQGSTTTAFQLPAYGSGYPYIPYYIPSAPYATINNIQSYSQPPQVTNSSGITSGSMAVIEESRKAPRHHKVGNSSPCKVSRSLTEASAECITNDVAEQRENFGSSLTNNIGESTSSLGNIPTRKERSFASGKSESSTKRTNSQTGDSGYKQNSMSESLTADGHCFKQNTLELRNSEDSGAILASKDQNLSSAEGPGAGFPLAADKLSKIQSCCNPLKNYLPDVTKVDKSTEVDSGHTVIKKLEELKTKDKKLVSERACCGETPENPADFTLVIKPKDVILAIGQQQFWKARKAILRQQRIFSDQVFQLHKLIMIQQLLAETPGTLIDEAVHFETVEECDVSAPVAKRTINSGNCALNAGASKKVRKIQSVDAEGFPAVSKDAKKEVRVSMPDVIHGGINAWGYPSFGQWIGPMAAQGQPYDYEPLAPGLSPAAAFGLPYGSGSASPMVSYGIPYCGQQQEFPAEMGSNYGPATVSKVDGNGLKSRNFGHFSKDFLSSWYIMQHSNLNHDRVHSAGSGKDAPAGSGASVTKSSVAARGVKTSCFPGLAYPRGISSQAAAPLSTKGLESSGQQSEISSSSSVATRLGCSAAPLAPSVPVDKKLGLSHREVQNQGQNFDMASEPRSHSADSRRSVDKEDVDARGCPNIQKEGGNSPVDGGSSDACAHLPEVGWALELFPLVPVLSSFIQNREHDSKAVEDRQGHVIRAVPRRAIAASESAAGILRSLQREKQK